MKTLLTSAFLALSINAFAADPFFYTPDFEVTQTKVLCPRIDGEPHCEAIATKVTLTATLGCIDELLFSRVEHRYVPGTNTVNLHVVSVAKAADMQVQCIRANTVTIDIVVPYEEVEFNVVNVKFDSEGR